MSDAKLTPNDLTHLTARELISIALAVADYDEGDSIGWNAIAELHKRGTEEIFTLSQSLCQGNDPHEQAIGADILGQLGWPAKYPFRDQTLPILFQLMETSPAVEVLNSACIALGHLHDERAIEPLLKLKKHPHEEVRYGVVLGLTGFEDERAIHALTELSKDSDSDVRDWATFGLGSMIETNTEAIREALYQRLNDSDETTRGEAMVGLARRGDKRVTPFVLAELEQMSRWTLPLEAAEALADPSLLPALYHFQANWTGEETWIYNTLEAAITACQIKQNHIDSPN
jgi:HEAT repeat protein